MLRSGGYLVQSPPEPCISPPTHTMHARNGSTVLTQPETGLWVARNVKLTINVLLPFFKASFPEFILRHRLSLVCMIR